MIGQVLSRTLEMLFPSVPRALKSVAAIDVRRETQQ
jgi:hypothetical protein